MTSKKGQSWRIEADIDKSREEGNWKKVIDLTEQLKTLCPSNGKHPNFAICLNTTCYMHY